MSILDTFNRRARLIADFRDTFESPQGQRVLQFLAEQNFVLTPTFVAGDSHQTALHEGQRRVVLSIMKYIGTDVAKLQQMAEEKAQ